MLISRYPCKGRFIDVIYNQLRPSTRNPEHTQDAPDLAQGNRLVSQFPSLSNKESHIQLYDC